MHFRLVGKGGPDCQILIGWDFSTTLEMTKYIYLQAWDMIVIDARTRRICLLAMPSLSLLTTEAEKSQPIIFNWLDFSTTLEVTKYINLQAWDMIVIDARTRRICLLAMLVLTLLTTEA